MKSNRHRTTLFVVNSTAPRVTVTYNYGRACIVTPKSQNCLSRNYPNIPLAIICFICIKEGGKPLGFCTRQDGETDSVSGTAYSNSNIMLWQRPLAFTRHIKRQLFVHLCSRRLALAEILLKWLSTPSTLRRSYVNGQESKRQPHFTQQRAKK